MEFSCKYVRKYHKVESWTGNISIIRKYNHLVEAQVSGRGSSFTILLGDYVNGNFLCIPEINVGCPLSSWDDTFWNMERLSQLMNPVDAATIICGIKALEQLEG